MKKHTFIYTIILVFVLCLSNMVCIAEVDSSNQLPQSDSRLSKAVVLYVGSSETLVNSSKTKIDSTNDAVTPVIIGSRTLVPVRFISEAFGATVNYDTNTRMITVVLGTTNIKLTIDKTEMLINGRQQILEVSAQIINNRTFIPLRAMVNALGKKLFWDNEGLIVISDTDNILDSVKDADFIGGVVKQLKSENSNVGKQPNNNKDEGAPQFIGSVISVNANVITVSSNQQSQNVTVNVPDGLKAKLESKPQDPNPTNINISDIKAGMHILIWYTDNTKTTISQIKVSNDMGGQTAQSGSGMPQTAPPYDWIDLTTTPVEGTQYKLYDTPTRGAGTQGSYLIYLPDSYNTDTTKHYPVIYWLHGGFGYQSEGATASLQGFISAMKAGNMPECIIVYPQGLPSGWYCNSKDGSRPVEDVLIKDLIPAIDNTYRTISTSVGRGIEGMSMGGYGALHLGLKYSNIFSTISAVGPSIQPSLVNEEEIRTKDTFFDDESYYEQNSPQGLATSELANIKSNSPLIRILGGTADGLRTTIINFDAQLTTLGIKHIFAQAEGAGHDYNDIISKINNPYDFWEMAFANAK